MGKCPGRGEKLKSWFFETPYYTVLSQIVYVEILMLVLCQISFILHNLFTVPVDIDHTPVSKFSIKGSQIPQFLELILQN